MKTLCQIINILLMLTTFFIGYLIYFLLGREVMVLSKKIKRNELTVARLNSKPETSLICFGLGIITFFVIITVLSSIASIL